MVDPLSIAGLAVAVFDQILRLGDRTIQFMSDAQAYDQNVSSLQIKIKDETHRTKLLKLLLFEQSPIYRSRTLFEELDEEAQDQIKLYLLQLAGKLHEAVELLRRRYAAAAANQAPVPSNSSAETLNILEALRQHTRTPLRIIRWSLYDKKRAEAIVLDFTDLNARIHEHIKLMCMASSIGVSFADHLRRLETDPSSKSLGFNIDASLRSLKLSSDDARAGVTDFELPDSPWTSALASSQPIEGHFAIVRVGAKCYIQEFQRYSAEIRTSFGTSKVASENRGIDQRTRKFVNGLTKLLQQPKEHAFLIPSCAGWKYVSAKGGIAFLFEIPQHCLPTAISLSTLLGDKSIRLSLNEKLSIAFGLARCISQLQLVNWVHESFRSENILFFGTRSTDPNRESIIDYTTPNVFGFEYSRPVDGISMDITDVCIERDVYRHPDRQGRPEKRFNKLHDIYALGVVLLEVGLWEPWDSMPHLKAAYDQGPTQLQKMLQKHAAQRLGRHMGERYKRIVLQCLSDDFDTPNDTAEGLRLQQAFRADVVNKLEKMVDSV